MPIVRSEAGTAVATPHIYGPDRTFLPARGSVYRPFEEVYRAIRERLRVLASSYPSGAPIVWRGSPPPRVSVAPKDVQPIRVPAPSVPTVPRASVPSVLPDPVPRGEPIVLTGPPITPGGGMIVKVDPNNPGRYIIYMPNGEVYPNSSREFVDAVGAHVPDDPTIIKNGGSTVSDFDLGDVLLDVARTVLPRAVEEWVGITPPGFAGPAGVGYAPPAALPAPGGGMPGIPPGYGANKRQPTWRYDGWVFKDGKWVRSRRRRRRKLLTEGDFNSLLKIQTLKNTDNIKIALSKALR